MDDEILVSERSKVRSVRTYLGNDAAIVTATAGASVHIDGLDVLDRNLLLGGRVVGAKDESKEHIHCYDRGGLVGRLGEERLCMMMMKKRGGIL